VRGGGGPVRSPTRPGEGLAVEAAAAVHALEHAPTCRDGRPIVRLVAVGDCESEGEQTLRSAVSARQDPDILP
jgi:hypothetical protein